VLGARGVGREEGNVEWDGHELEKLESRGIEARRGVLGADATVMASYRPGGVRVGVAHAGKGKQGRAGAVADVQVTPGVCPSRRWRRGGARAAVGGADSRRQREAEEQRGARGRRREGGPRDSFAKIESPGTSL
jgi:hypothetical protein